MKKTSGVRDVVAVAVLFSGISETVECFKCGGLHVEFGLSTSSKDVNDKHWFCHRCGPTKVLAIGVTRKTNGDL